MASQAGGPRIRLLAGAGPDQIVDTKASHSAALGLALRLDLGEGLRLGI